MPLSLSFRAVPTNRQGLVIRGWLVPPSLDDVEAPTQALTPGREGDALAVRGPGRLAEGVRIGADQALEAALAAHQPQGRLSEALTGLANERDALTVWRPHGQRLVLRIVSQSLRAGAVGSDRPDVEAVSAVRNECDADAIRAPRRADLPVEPRCELPHPRAVRSGDGHLEPRPDERDLAAVRRPRRCRHGRLRERREDGDVRQASLLPRSHLPHPEPLAPKESETSARSETTPGTRHR